MKIQPPAPLLTDGDLTLQRWQLADAEDLLAAVTQSIHELRRWMPWAADGYTLADAQSFLAFATAAWDAGEEYNFAVVVNGRISGSCGLMRPVSAAAHTLEIGYWLARDVTRRGLATRAAALLVRTAFASGAKHVQIRHDELNSRSAAIPRRLGFTCLGALLLGANTNGNGTTNVLWQMDKESP